MAVSSTSATIYILRQNFPISTTKNTSVLLNFAPRKTCRHVIRSSSSDGTAESTAATKVQEEEEESETLMEVPEGPSLISALNVERALRGIPITDVDYYGRLGVKRGCSNEEVTVAYKNKVEELLKQGLDEEDVRKEMELLKESYAILSSEDERRMYDWSLARSENPDRYAWPYETDKVKPSPDTPPPVQENPGGRNQKTWKRQDWWDTFYWVG
ncbi:heat shock protein binding protein, putative [Ricinus communis]|uniref:Heat shock protein binding protein, putative n=1 Tax=Ricinus communis TaxID=3988 RepID=B9RQV6_RICCO|nr:heat shock protein binding protein, putative [Ricinus communis]